MKLIEKISKRHHIRYAPSEINTINTATPQLYSKIPKGDSVISLLNGNLEINFDVVHAATNNRYTDGDNISLDNLGPNALFSIRKITTTSGKYLEDIQHCHIVFLMYKVLTSTEDFDDLSICFNRDRNRRQREVTINKNQKGKFHVRVMLKTVVAFAEQ